jgi:hypothetical protein
MVFQASGSVMHVTGCFANGSHQQSQVSGMVIQQRGAWIGSVGVWGCAGGACQSLLPN